MAATTNTAFRSACRSSAAASTISVCSVWPRRSRACGVRRSRGHHRRRSNDLFDVVRAGLVPAIHVLVPQPERIDVDGRDKPGHDDSKSDDTNEAQEEIKWRMRPSN